MDHLAVFDGFGSTSFDLTGLPATDLDRSSTYRRDRDKGKARACEDSDDAFDHLDFPSAESSRSGHSLSTLGDNTSPLRETGSVDLSDRKGKARQHINDLNDFHACDHPDTRSHQPTDFEIASTSATRSYCQRQPALSMSIQSGPCERTASVPCPYHDEVSLKRTIRQMGSSPSSSPRQHTHTLPVTQACSSTSRHRLDVQAADVASSSSFSLGPSSAHPRSSMANKKRRSFRPDELDNTAFTEHHAASPQAVQTSDIDTSLRFDRHDRRASLLLNSSTRHTRSLQPSSTRYASPEPLDTPPRSEQPSFDLSQRRSAFLASARVQRSTSTIRRRTGFYLRDADLLRNDLSEETLAPTDQPSSTASETFTSEFSRAVDLRLAARPTSSQASAATSDSLRRPQAGPRQASRHSVERPSAPQLPYPRTASPLSISFATVDTDQSSQLAQSGLTARNSRRRIPVSTHDEFALVDQDDSSTATSRRSLYRPAFWGSTSTQLGERSSLVSPTDSQISYRLTTTRRETSAWRANVNRLQTGAAASATAASDQPLNEQQSPRHAQRPVQSLEPQTRDEATADDFGAVQRPFGLRGSRFTRRALRSGIEDDLEASPNTATRARAGASAGAGTDQAQTTPLRQGVDHSTDQGASEIHEQRSSLPWRRTHFGLRAPSRLPEPQLSPARPRFEPFAEHSGAEPRRSASLADSWGSVSNSSSYRERHGNESALEYLGRLMSHDSMLDEWMAGDVHGPLLRMAIESEVLQSYPHLRHLGRTPASTSSMFGQAPHLAFDARNFIADEDWAELNSYEGLMQLSERLGAAEVCVPQSLIDTLPTCEYGKWDGGTCRQRDALSASPPLVGKGKGKGKQKVEPPATTRDTMCPICREDYLDSDMLMSINKCCHAFHSECIKVSGIVVDVDFSPASQLLADHHSCFLCSGFLSPDVVQNGQDVSSVSSRCV